MAAGRPKIAKEIVEEILDRIADGEGLWKICSDPRMPARGTVLRWAASDPEFCDRYTRAMHIGVDSQLDDADRVARDGGKDIVREDMGDGIVVERVDHENIQRSKLIIDQIRWKASKLVPKKYGDKLGLEHTGAGGGPIVTAVEVRLVRAVDGKRADDNHD